MDTSDSANGKTPNDNYTQPFAPVADKTSGFGGPSLGMKSLGPNMSDWSRKANTNEEQVNPQTTIIKSGDPLLTDIMNCGKMFHESGND